MTQSEAARELQVPEQVLRRCLARGMQELAAQLVAGSAPGNNGLQFADGNGTDRDPVRFAGTLD